MLLWKTYLDTKYNRYLQGFQVLNGEEQLKTRFSSEEADKIRNSYKAQQDAQAYTNIPKFISHHQTLEDALDKVTKQHQEKYQTQWILIRQEF